MKDTQNFDSLDPELILKYAKEAAGEAYTDGLGIVIRVAFADKRHLPAFKKFKDTEVISLSDYVLVWVNRYLGGYNNRPSVRTGNKSKTYSDPVIKFILQARLPDIQEELAEQLEAGHSSMMTIENLVGDLLEEYLCPKLQEKGWYCAWGTTMDAIDFCKADGSVLQVKNSDNSENSSSSRVRNGTLIGKWARRVSTKPNTFFWDKLNKMVGRNDLTEGDFRDFIAEVMEKNPDCLHIDENSPLSNL